MKPVAFGTKAQARFFQRTDCQQVDVQLGRGMAQHIRAQTPRWIPDALPHADMGHTSSISIESIQQRGAKAHGAATLNLGSGTAAATTVWQSCEGSGRQLVENIGVLSWLIEASLRSLCQ